MLQNLREIKAYFKDLKNSIAAIQTVAFGGDVRIANISVMQNEPPLLWLEIPSFRFTGIEKEYDLGIVILCQPQEAYSGDTSEAEDDALFKAETILEDIVVKLLADRKAKILNFSAFTDAEPITNFGADNLHGWRLSAKILAGRKNDKCL